MSKEKEFYYDHIRRYLQALLIGVAFFKILVLRKFWSPEKAKVRLPQPYQSKFYVKKFIENKLDEVTFHEVTLDNQKHRFH